MKLTLRRQFFLKAKTRANSRLLYALRTQYSLPMSWQSLPYAPRQIRATEARLQRIYDAASLGLKGDRLALAAGMLPTEYRRLCSFDPYAQVAEDKGRADSELEAATQLRDAARNGDAKAALAILTHTHSWVAKQQIDVTVDQRISITQALELAQQRVEARPAIEHQDANVLEFKASKVETASA